MNERIQELARQADAYAWQQIDEGADYDTQPQFFAEKFAELIVRECAKVARDTDLEDVEGGDSEVLRAAKRQILEHFGVEL